MRLRKLVAEKWEDLSGVCRYSADCNAYDEDSYTCDGHAGEYCWRYVTFSAGRKP